MYRHTWMYTRAARARLTLKPRVPSPAVPRRLPQARTVTDCLRPNFEEGEPLAVGGASEMGGLA